MEKIYSNACKDAVELAINQEAESEQCYTTIADKIHEPTAKNLLKQLAIEEKTA